MRQVHHHAHAIHLGDHRFAERAQTVVLGRLRVGGIGNVIVSGVRQRQVAAAQVVILSDQGQVVANDVAVLDADHRDQLASAVNALYFVG